MNGAGDRTRADERRLGALPLGELHAEGVCFRCGRKGPLIERGAFGELLHEPDAEGAIDLDAGLKRTVNAATQAVAHICVDIIACERRRYRKGNP